MRGCRFLLVASLVVIGMISPTQVGSAERSVDAVAATTPSGQFKVYNVSLKLVACTKNASCTGEWKTYFQRLAEKDYRPDIINILEVPFTKKDVVLNQLATSTGTALTSWGEVHSDKDTPCTDPATTGQDLQHCGNNMVVWSYSKFAKVDHLRFVRTEATSTNSCHYGGRPYSKDVAVSLQEKDASGTPIPGRVVVTAAVHLSKDLGPLCAREALSRIEQDLGHFQSRPLTVVTGDFNKQAHIDGTSIWARRREVCLDDWYRSWAVPGTPMTGNCSPEPGTDFGGSYLDAVRWKHYGDGDSFCWEWTFSNQVSAPEPGSCSREDSEKKRIDYIWIRRESTPGAPIRDASLLGPTVLSAETDRGYHQDSTWANRYSDHRALEALLAF